MQPARARNWQVVRGMYRIELAKGEVTVFRTIEELATGVRNGVITPRARIYHAATDKWLPIEFHPHYKKVIETPPGQPIHVPQPRPDERARGERPSFGDAAGVHAPAASPFASPVALAPSPEPEPEPEPDPPADELAGEPAPTTLSPVLQLPRIVYPEVVRPGEPAQEDHAPHRERSRRPVHVAGAAVALALGGYLVTSGFSPSRTDAAPVIAPAVADRPEMPAPEASAPAPSGASSDAHRSPAAAPTVAPSKQPAPKPPAPPASSGFAAALEPRANVAGPAPVRTPPPGAAATPDSTVAGPPAPIELDVALPELGGADSVEAQARHRDSTAMKQILRALNGKAAPARP